MPKCASINCGNYTSHLEDFCSPCISKSKTQLTAVEMMVKQAPDAMSSKYPQYFKDVTELTEVDVYAIHHLFEIDDPAGCIQHASKKLLLSGVRTGGKSKYQDIKEARDTLNRWLELNSKSI